MWADMENIKGKFFKTFCCERAYRKKHLDRCRLEYQEDTPVYQRPPSRSVPLAVERSLVARHQMCRVCESGRKETHIAAASGGYVSTKERCVSAIRLDDRAKMDVTS